MSLIDLFRSQRIRGRILDQYRLESGNIAMVVEEFASSRRYTVEFKTDEAKPCLDNLYGLVSEPFFNRGQHLEHLLEQGQYVDLTVNYARGPMRHAYSIHSVSSRRSYGPQPRPQRAPYAPTQNY